MYKYTQAFTGGEVLKCLVILLVVMSLMQYIKLSICRSEILLLVHMTMGSQFEKCLFEVVK